MALHFFNIQGILLILYATDHIFHGGGLPSAYGQVVRPPNFSPDAIPETSFTCEDKITGGYYADLEADCQLFHVCVQVSEYEVRVHSYKFLDIILLVLIIQGLQTQDTE